MSDILLLPSLSISLFIESALFLLLSYSFILSITLLRKYKKSASDHTFYLLELKSHLLVSIVTLSIFIKITLFPFFFNTLNSLSSLIPGAMCSAGVVSANKFGDPTLWLKTFTLLIALLWLRLNNKDEITATQPYFQKKLWLFNLFYISVAIELFLEFSFFTHLSTETPVLCCSSLFNHNEVDNILLTLPKIYLLSFFTLSFILSLLLNFFKKRYFATMSIFLFSYLSYYAIVYIFSPYIYELPTHKCPYCMMQSNYHYIGYFIYFTLFISIYYSLVTLFFNFETRDYKKSSFFLILFFLLSLSNFLFYFIKNGTLLSPLF